MFLNPLLLNSFPLLWLNWLFSLHELVLVFIGVLVLLLGCCYLNFVLFSFDAIQSFVTQFTLLHCRSRFVTQMHSFCEFQKQMHTCAPYQNSKQLVKNLFFFCFFLFFLLYKQEWKIREWMIQVGFSIETFFWFKERPFSQQVMGETHRPYRNKHGIEVVTNNSAKN